MKGALEFHMNSIPSPDLYSVVMLSMSLVSLIFIERTARKRLCGGLAFFVYRAFPVLVEMDTNCS